MVGTSCRLVGAGGQTHRSRSHRSRIGAALSTPRSLWRRIASRFVQSLIVVIIVTTISFFVIRTAPGDPFSYDSTRVSEAIRAQWRAQFGYDRPLTEQYARYASSVIRGKLGYSIALHRPVSDVLADAVPRTLLLTGLSRGHAFVIGVSVGVMQAARRGSLFDRASSGLLVFFYSLPDFWAALMILLTFAYWIPVLPAGGMVDSVMHDYLGNWDAFVDRLRHLILPVASLTLLTTASIARYQRTAMLEVLPAEYIRSARAKGLSEREILWRHAFRNALTPMVTLAGLLIPSLLGGALFIEKVFSWPGMGMIASNAIAGRDYDVVTATVIVGSILVVLGNLFADIAQLALDPRVRE
jgi:peptide/nickel transport system permease protein